MKLYLLIPIILSVGLVACRGPEGIQGDTVAGPKGSIGLTGGNGPVGLPGTSGLNGSNGTDATILTVQFCQGITPAYPSTFPELGFCISNQLYGVYSANDGFMVLLPPGTYTSNGLNATCTFTVGENCQVSN